MKSIILVGVLAVVGVGMGGVAAYLAAGRGNGSAGTGEFVSGPQVGSKLPGPFEPLNLNGPDAGDECCLFCKYGNNPVVMVFASKPSEELAFLLRHAEKAAAGAKGEVGACVVVTDTSAATRTQLNKLIDREKIKHVLVGVIDAPKLKKYELHPDAEVTVLLYSKQVVRENRAFKSGELKDKAIEDLAGQFSKHFAGE